ncbi:unnamed protein product, partial [Ixodes pacificus]
NDCRNCRQKFRNTGSGILTRDKPCTRKGDWRLLWNGSRPEISWKPKQSRGVSKVHYTQNKKRSLCRRHETFGQLILQATANESRVTHTRVWKKRNFAMANTTGKPIRLEKERCHSRHGKAHRSFRLCQGHH